MLIILDTSVIFAFLLSKKESYTRDIILLGYKGKFIFVISHKTYQELKEKISTKKCKTSKYYNERTVGKFIVWYKHNTKKFEQETKSLEKESRDPNDNIFLTLAVKSKADYIISVDKDLLELRSVGKTKIVTPREFMNVFLRGRGYE